MKTNSRKLWFIHLLIFSLYTLATVDSISMTDTPTSTSSDVSVQMSTIANSNPVYIITSFDYPGTTFETTIATVQTNQFTSINSTPSITTNSPGNGTYIITSYSQMTTAVTTQSITTTTLTPIFCVNNTHILLDNGTCVSYDDAQIYAINILRSNSSNDTVKADALSLYLTAITNSNISSGSNYTLTIGEIDGIFGSLTNLNYTKSNNNSALILTQPGDILTNKTIIGLALQPAIGGKIVSTVNKENITNSTLIVAGIVELESLNNSWSFNILVVKDPNTFQSSDNSSDRIPVSSIVFATINGSHTDDIKINIGLYYKVLKTPGQTDNETYMCAFYNTNTLQWNSTGCSTPVYNSTFDRYECQCNHLTSFALIWLPRPLTNDTRVVLDAQDKASIAFQIISILCFLGIVTHATIVRIISPKMSTEPRTLLPLISCGITMILFVFYIALGLTVYSRYTQSNPTRINSSSGMTYGPCLPNEQALMDIVYFFIIFMFCSKTSVGYYNYMYFVLLFPPPSCRRLFIALGLSALIGLIWMAFAVGFNSNPANGISQIYAGKICWFNGTVNQYFLTIPIVIFLVVNFILFILVAKHIIAHAELAQTDRSKYKLRKQCVIVLLASCVTQGFGWVFGPLIAIANPTAGEVLGWLFVIFNGLEGFWAILLYIIAHREQMDKNYRDTNDRYLELSNVEYGNSQPQLDGDRYERRTQQLQSLRSDSPRNSFTDLADIKPYRRSQHGDNDDR